MAPEWDVGANQLNSEQKFRLLLARRKIRRSNLMQAW
jgi:hypothetical protein